jgi:putative flippase GtrA
MVLGVRDFGPEVPFRSRFGNIMTRVVFRLFTGRRIADTQTGLRGWPRAACIRCLRVNENGFDYLLECLLRVEAPLVQIPIQTIYLDKNRSSHFNPVRDSMRIYFLFLRYCGSSLLAFAVDSAVFYPVLFYTGSLPLSQIAARAASVSVNFLVVRNLVFQSGASVALSLAKYLALVAASGSIAYTLIRFIHTQLGLPIVAAKLIAEGLLFLGNFAIQRDLIFTRKS